MKIQIALLALLLGGAPASLVAQQEAPARGEQKPHARRGPVEKLIRYREELNLTDAQIQALQEIDRRMTELNRPHVQELIRIRRQVHEQIGVAPGVHPRDLTPEQRAELKRRSEIARPAREQIHKNNRALMLEVGNVLTDEQKARLRDMLQKHRERNGQSGPEGRRGRRGPGG